MINNSNFPCKSDIRVVCEYFKSFKTLMLLFNYNLILYKRD